MNLSDYYKRAELYLPENPNFRLFRVLKGEEALTIKDRIRNVGQLRKWLIKLSPDHVYYSLSQYADPTIVKSKILKKAGWCIASNNIIGHDFGIDVDAKTIDDAKPDTLEIADWLETQGYELNFRCSGKKGFHIIVKNFGFDLPASIKERDTAILEQKADIINGIQDLNVECFDALISIDTRRIIRLPQTINGGSGCLCEIIKKSQIEKYEPKRIIGADA